MITDIRIDLQDIETLLVHSTDLLVNKEINAALTDIHKSLALIRDLLESFPERMPENFCYE